MRARGILLISLAGGVLSGCAVQPEALTADEITAFAVNKRGRATANQEPLRGKLTLDGAMARALKYNLDKEVEVMQAALAQQQLRVAHFSLLPGAVAGTGLSDRNNYSGGSSVQILGPRTLGSESLTSSTSSERDVRTADIRFSWHILDFGLSYIRAQQASDQVLIADEARRRVITRMLEKVRTAYWRAVAAARLEKGLRSLEGRVARALVDSRALEKSGESSPLTALNYERELIEIQREIRKLTSELANAKVQLAALANLDPGTPYQLDIPNSMPPPKRIPLGGEELVSIALQNRSELREVAYRKRINAHDAEAAILQMLPGLSLEASPVWNSNKFLYNSHWVSWGAQASWNLINVFSYPERRKEVEAKDALLDARALAVTMAIMTQVQVGRARVFHARRDFATAERYFGVQRRIRGLIRSALESGKVSEQTAIREEMNTLVAMVKRDMAYAELQSAAAGLIASIGVAPGERLESDRMSVADIELAIGKRVNIVAR